MSPIWDTRPHFRLCVMGLMTCDCGGDGHWLFLWVKRRSRAVVKKTDVPILTERREEGEERVGTVR